MQSELCRDVGDDRLDGQALRKPVAYKNAPADRLMPTGAFGPAYELRIGIETRPIL